MQYEQLRSKQNKPELTLTFKLFAIIFATIVYMESPLDALVTSSSCTNTLNTHTHRPKESVSLRAGLCYPIYRK